MPYYPAHAAPENREKPYRVTAYQTLRGVVHKCFVVGDYRYYWQANLVSFFWHHVLGYGCNTWKAGMAK